MIRHPLNIDRSYRIVIDSDALRPAANALCAYLEPLVHTPLSVTRERVSPCLRLTVDPTLEAGYTLTADAPDLVIAGRTLEAAVRGVYGFLSELCGIRWFTDSPVYPEKMPEIPGDTAISYLPPFEYTELDWYFAKQTEYALFNHVTGTKYRPLPKELGGGTAFLSGFAHTLTKEFCAADTYFAAHPEYFALHRGKRTAKQLCLSNPDVRRIVTDEVLALLKKKHDPEAPLQIVSLSQADNLAFCRCPACRAADKKHGSHAGSLLRFVNEIARAVKAAGYDNVAIETLAYQYTRKPPLDLRPEPNVIVRLCAIECCFSHPLNDPSCKVNRAFAEDLRAWAALCSRLYVWEYGADYCHFAGLFPDFNVLSDNMRFFAEAGVKGVYSEGNYTLTSPDVAFGELRAYLLSRLFYDPTCDLQPERTAFLSSVYGSGAEAIDAFLDLFCHAAAKRHVGVFQPIRHTPSLTAAEIKQCDALWDEAEAAAGDAVEAVRRARLCWHYWKLENRKDAFKNPFTRRAHRTELYEALANAEMTRLQESSPARAHRISRLQALYVTAHPLASRVMRWQYRL